MKKRILVKWAEYHEQEIEADIDGDDLLMMVEINDLSETYRSASFKGAEVVGEVERDCFYEDKAERESA